MNAEDWLGESNQLGIDIWHKKYQYDNETFDAWLDRVTNYDENLKNLIISKKFLFGGRILANRGLDKYGIKTTLSNCYVARPPEDNIESIFDTAKKLARTYSYGGGIGVDISKLAPRGAKVNNAAKYTSGAVSFMDLYSLVTETIGQNGRRGALMISLSVDHPDIIEFIQLKTDLNRVNKANLSVRMSDEFMQAVQNNKQFRLHFTRETTGEIIEKVVYAKDVMKLISQCNWDYGEPGMLFWDRIESYNLLSEDNDFHYAGVNPCITGDTKIFTGDGRYIVDVSTLFKEYSDNPIDFKVPVLTWDSELSRNKMEYINWIQYSGKKKVYKIWLDDGTFVKATDNHKFMLSDGSLIYVKDLKPGDSLMPMRAHVAAPVKGGKTYHDLYVNMNDGTCKNYYHLQSELLFNEPLEAFGRHKNELNVHHEDENHENNSLSNLRVMTASDHFSHHQSGENNPMIRWWNSAPEDVKNSYRCKMSKAVSGEHNPNYGHKASEEKLRKMSEATSNFMKNPETKERHKLGLARGRSRQIKQVIDILKDNGLELNESNYESHRNLVSKTCTSWNNISECADILGFSDLAEYFNWLQCEFNHTVVSIEYAGEEDVYDINVHNNHNFAVVTSGYEEFNGELSSLHSLSGIIIGNCAEESLPAGGSCLLGSINLSEFVKNPFMDNAYFDFSEFKRCIPICVRGLNDVLHEGQGLHPLEEQRESVDNWRQIGLGIMGLADMLIKLHIRYGSPKCIKLCDRIGFELANSAINTSCELVNKYGTYPKYKKCVMHSDFFDNNAELTTRINVEKYGLANSQLLTIAPTGTLSTMLGISGGIEPVFSYQYTRKTESLHGEDKYYTVHAKIVLDYLEAHPEADVEYLPDYFVDALHLNYKERVDVQSTWQKHIDASISSTVNVPEEFTVDDVENMYMYAWKQGCKGVTLFRTNCKRVAVLNPKSEESDKEEIAKQDNIEKSNMQEQEAIELNNNVTHPTEVKIQSVNDNVIGRKRKLMTGCGTLHCEAFFDPTTGKLLETYLSKGSTGGCNNFMIGLSRMISLSARAGVSIEDIIDQLDSTGVCPSYAVRRAVKHDTSKGSCCPMAVGNALRSMYEEIQSELHTHKCKCHKLEDSIDSSDSLSKCPECGQSLIFEGGCVICKNCGWSKCN